MTTRVDVPVEAGWLRPTDLEIAPMLAVLAATDANVTRFDLHTGPYYSMRVFVNADADGGRVARVLHENIWVAVRMMGDEEHIITTDYGVFRIAFSRLPDEQPEAA
jgi:hypothetical protein